MATEKEILIIEIRADGARVVKRNLNEVGHAADKTADAAQQLKTLLGGLVTARAIKGTVMLADSYANLLNRLRVVTGSNHELNRAMMGVYQITRETRTALEGNVDMYARVALNTRKMGFEMKDVLRFSKQLNHAIILSGVTAREAQWGMVQFSQALAAGALRGDELRAVMEQLPVVTDVITEHLKIGRGELRKLAFEGRVTTQVIIDSFNAAEQSLAERFGKRIPTLDQGITVLRSSFIRFIGEQDQAWQGTSTLAQALLWASDNMDTLGRYAQIAATILGGILLNNTITLISQWELLSLQVLKTHGWLILLGTAAAAIVVYADKIKLATGETATLADTVRGLGPEFTAAAEGAALMWNNLTDAAGLDKLRIEAEVTLEGILITIGRIADRFAGIMQGGVAAIVNGVRVIGDHLMRILRHIGAFGKAIFQGFKQDMAALRSALVATAGAARHALAGNLEQARNYANIAVAALKQGAGTGVLDFYKEQAALIEAEFSSTGKTSGEAFWNAFHGAGTASEDMMKRAMGRARVTAAKRDEGELTQSVNQRGLTPTQQTMFSKLTGEVAKLNSAASDLNTIMEKGVLDTISDLDAAMKRGEVSSQEFTTQMSGLKSELMQYVTSEQELRALREEGIITNTDYANSLVQVNENQARINNTFTIGSVTIEDYNRKLTEMQLKALATGTGVADGFKRGFLELGLEITNFSDVAQKTVTNAFAGMEDALVSFVTTGKVDFKGMVDSMLADLTRLLARQLVVKALGAMGNSAGGGLGALFSSAAGAATTRAGGGPTSPGGTYVINDDGKEMLHMGNQRGFVSNARDTKAAAPAAQAPIIVYNLWSDEDIGQYMNDDNKGGRIIVNKSPGQGRGQAR